MTILRAELADAVHDVTASLPLTITATWSDSRARVQRGDIDSQLI